MDFSFVDKSANRQTPDETLMVLTYELGEVVKCSHYAKRYGGVAYVESMKCAVGDMISMIRMFCEQMGWSYAELMKFGEEHYLERQEDLKKHGR